MAVSQQKQVDSTRRTRSLFDILEIGGQLDKQPNIFDRLDIAERKRVQSHIYCLELEPKNMLFHQGEWQNGIYIIETGFIRTFYSSPTGREITLAYWQPGNFVGGPDVFGESAHMWSGVAVKPSRVIAIKGEDLRLLMEDIPQLAIGVVEALIFKGKCFSALIQMLGTRSVSDRLAQLLLMLVETHGEPDNIGGFAIQRQFTHEDLAHMVGASRQWVTTMLDRMQHQGIVHIRKRQVVVLRPDLLAGHRAH